MQFRIRISLFIWISIIFPFVQRSLARPRFQRQLLSLWESECAKPTRKWCVPRTFPRNPAILRVWSRSTPWAPLRADWCQKTSELTFFLLLLLGKDRNAARNVAIIGLEKTRQDEKKGKKGPWNEMNYWNTPLPINRWIITDVGNLEVCHLLDYYSNWFSPFFFF